MYKLFQQTETQRTLRQSVMQILWKPKVLVKGL